MRIGRFSYQGQVFYGQVTEDNLVYQIFGDIYREFETAKQPYALTDLMLLSPLMPSKIIAVGLNLREHVKEFALTVPDEPLLFMKAPTTVIGPNEAIVLPPESKQVDFEGELAVVIGRRAKNISVEDAPSVILGYTCANDVTARDLQQKDGQWFRAKSYDTFCPLGPYVVTDIDPHSLTVSVYLNGVLKQHFSTASFIFDVPTLVAYISNIMTLLPGDVILTGTSSGVQPMTDGSIVEVEISQIGCLKNHVITK